jgi:hypothetical protein
LLLGAVALSLSAASAFAQQPYAPYGYLQSRADVAAPAAPVPAPVMTVSGPEQLAMPYLADGPKPAYGTMVVNPGQHMQPCCGKPGCDTTPICDHLPNMDDPCCHPEPCKQKHCCLVGGAGVYYVRPYWENNPAVATFTGLSIASEQDFDYQYEVAPYAWAGYVSEGGLGVRGRAFYYDYNADNLTLTDASNTVQLVTASPLGLGIFTQGTAGAGETLTIDSSLRLKYVDLEITQQFQIGSWWLLISGGGRWGEIAQNYDATLDDQADDLQTVAIRSGHSFRGAGPTVAFEARRAFCCGFALYGSARGALLIGDHKQNAFLLSIDGDNDADSDLLFANSDEKSTLPVTELEVGCEFGKEIRGARLFVQAAVVNHTWFGAGNATNTASAITVSGDDFDSFFITDARDERANLSLFGGKLVIGINY